jgi:Family of unknown function (DUF6698)
MTTVTTNVIAYVATIVRLLLIIHSCTHFQLQLYFSLSSQEVFCARGSNSDFDYFEFYRGLIASIDEELSPFDCAEVLAWWNQ